jgi:hypothetical protein
MKAATSQLRSNCRAALAMRRIALGKRANYLKEAQRHITVTVSASAADWWR